MGNIRLLDFAADMPGRLRRWLTFRRVLGIAVFLILLLCLRELIGIGADLTFILGWIWVWSRKSRR